MRKLPSRPLKTRRWLKTKTNEVTYLKQHAQQVKDNLDRLARVNYLPFIQENYGETSTPDYVVMFLPSDALYHAALEQMPKLAQEGFRKSE